MAPVDSNTFFVYIESFFFTKEFLLPANFTPAFTPHNVSGHTNYGLGYRLSVRGFVRSRRGTDYARTRRHVSNYMLAYRIRSNVLDTTGLL